MFKQKDIVTQDEINVIEEECDVCYLHEKAYEFFDKMRIANEEELCPYCNDKMNNFAYGYDNKIVVGGHNRYAEDENIGYHKVYFCDNCNKVFVIKPQEIMYNGGHDIFYDGGNRFLNHSDEDLLMSKVKEQMEHSINHFVERVQSGEKGLGLWNLNYWIEGDLKQAMAEFLYEKGFKK